jgi:hypothetical protein
MLADACAVAFLTNFPFALVHTDARAMARLACPAAAVMLADACAVAFPTIFPFALVLANARTTTLAASAAPPPMVAVPPAHALQAARARAAVLAGALYGRVRGGEHAKQWQGQGRWGPSNAMSKHYLRDLALL